MGMGWGLEGGKDFVLWMDVCIVIYSCIYSYIYSYIYNYIKNNLNPSKANQTMQTSHLRDTYLTLDMIQVINK